MYGSPCYIAPEVLGRNYKEKCDIWSLGIIFYLLLTFKCPFDGINDGEIIKKILKDPVAFTKIGKHRNLRCIDLGKKMLTKQPE